MKSLLETFQELNQAHFGNRLPETDLVWNSRLSSTAGRFCPGRRIQGFRRKPQIEIADYLRSIPDGEMHIVDTMLHEMIHLHLWAEGRPYGHTEEFHRIMKKVGAKRFNPVPKIRPYKHWYECPGCRVRVPARRRIDNSACMSCCKKHSGGRYDRRFRLELVDARDAGVEHFPVVQMSASKPNEPSPAPENEEPCLPPSEIVRRLEELKQFLLRKTTAKA